MSFIVAEKADGLAQNDAASIPSTHKGLLFLDGLRGIAALVVLVGHCRWLLWEGFSDGYLKHPGDYGFLGRLSVYFFSVFKYGHQAVLFFFVLSGFVIHLRYSKQLAEGKKVRFDGKDFFKRRAGRIYPLFFFTLLLTFVLDTTGSYLGFGIYSGRTPVALINENISTDHSAVNFFGNLFFIKSAAVNTWGTNGPLWSLKYEWWFYVAYPLLFLLNRKSPWLSLAVALALFISITVLFGAGTLFLLSVLQYLFSWWLGAVTADIYTGRMRVPKWVPAFFTICIPFALMYETRLSNSVIADNLWAVGFFGLVNMLLYVQARWPGRLRLLEKMSWLGDCSYSIYVTHFPMVVFINGLLLSYTANKMPREQWFFIAIALLLVSIGYLVHKWIEAPILEKIKNR
jgi:peptidoglycan/LPS O-acetylase OafA/YrhL